MKSRKLLIILGVSATLAVRGSLATPHSSKSVPPGTICAVTEDEAGVYAAYFRGESAARNLPVVVMRRTEARNYDVNNWNLRLAARGHGLPPELRADFTSKNKSNCAIGTITGIPNLKFISQREKNAVFANGWVEFHKRYGKDAEIVTLSRVGFNADKTLALLHVVGGVDHNGVAGELCVLEREGGEWVVKFRFQTVA